MKYIYIEQLKTLRNSPECDKPLRFIPDWDSAEWLLRNHRRICHYGFVSPRMENRNAVKQEVRLCNIMVDPSRIPQKLRYCLNAETPIAAELKIIDSDVFPRYEMWFTGFLALNRAAARSLRHRNTGVPIWLTPNEQIDVNAYFAANPDINSSENIGEQTIGRRRFNGEAIESFANIFRCPPSSSNNLSHLQDQALQRRPSGSRSPSPNASASS